jgi:putative spermidine/putrescine transport system substrate-binding protein
MIVGPSRRSFLGAAGAAVAAPFILPGRARAAETVVIRTPGGSRDDVFKEMVYEPFRKETGIEIVPVSANTSKLVAMAKIGQSEVDIVDNTTNALKRIEQANGLEPIPYGEFKYTNAEDIDPTLRTKYNVANSTYATLMGYDTNAFPHGKGPRSWAEFWDVKAFPGPRSLGSMDANGGDLELALLADGVSMDKLYPIDLDRAFKSLSRIRPAIAKFWESGAMSTQMLTDREVALSSVWSTRLSIAIEKGAPLEAQWNQCRVEVQAYSIMKFGKNVAGAKKFVDYALSADVQSALLKKMAFVPANAKAFAAMPKALVDPATGKPLTSRGFIMDADYWVDHGQEAVDYWSKWILQ